MVPLHVSDHAILRYLERAYGLNVDDLRRHIAGRCATAAQLGAIGVTVENVKFVLARNADETVVVTALKPNMSIGRGEPKA